MITFFWKKNLASSLRAPQENDAKFRFAMHPQGIRQFHDNCKIAKCQTVAILAPVYSCSVWHPHKKSNKDKIEKVQRRAARFVSNNFRRKASVSEMLHDLGWQSLDGRRQDQRLVLSYKIINGLASVETEDILTPADSRIRKNHSFKFKHLQANCDSYRYSFFPATISSWNNLPFGIEKVDSVEGFKLKLKEHTFRSP